MPLWRVVDDTAHFLFSCVSYQEHRKSFIRELKNQKIDETLVGLLNCENEHVRSAGVCAFDLIAAGLMELDLTIRSNFQI